MILQLLRDFSVSEVKRAIERAFACGCVTFDAIRMLVMSSGQPSFEAVPLSPERLAALPRVHIADVDAWRYRYLLSGGDQ
jgi:hypothetical protein